MKRENVSCNHVRSSVAFDLMFLLTPRKKEHEILLKRSSQYESITFTISCLYESKITDCQAKYYHMKDRGIGTWVCRLL